MKQHSIPFQQMRDFKPMLGQRHCDILTFSSERPSDPKLPNVPELTRYFLSKLVNVIQN